MDKNKRTTTEKECHRTKKVARSGSKIFIESVDIPYLI